MSRRLFEANATNNPAILDEIHGLLDDIRSAWEQIGPNAAQSARRMGLARQRPTQLCKGLTDMTGDDVIALYESISQLTDEMRCCPRRRLGPAGSAGSAVRPAHRQPARQRGKHHPLRAAAPS
jgi:hypothetical protein